MMKSHKQKLNHVTIYLILRQSNFAKMVNMSIRNITQVMEETKGSYNYLQTTSLSNGPSVRISFSKGIRPNVSFISKLDELKHVKGVVFGTVTETMRKLSNRHL